MTVESGLAAAGAAMRVGDPTLAETDVGPLIAAPEVARVADWVGEAVGRGAELLSGGGAVGERAFLPTVLFDPPDDVRVSTAEVFGPVVAVYPVDNMKEAAQRANAIPFAFQAAVLTRDFDTALAAFELFDASTVLVNDHTAFRVDWMPFAGLKRSGLGVGGIGGTIRDMQVERMLVMRRLPGDQA